MYKEPAVIMSFIVVSLFVVLCLVFFLSGKEINGALNKEGKSAFVCAGVFYKHIGYVTKYDFVCTDGREIYNLTNFTMKKEADK